MLRSQVISLLKRSREGQSLQKIARRLHLSPLERRELQKVLQTLVEEGIVFRLKRRFFLSRESKLIVGKFVASHRGYGFVTPEREKGEDIFIPGRYTSQALPGDIVEVLVKEKGKKGKREGRILRIIKKGRQKIIGLYQERFGHPYILSLDHPFFEEFSLGKAKPSSLKPGMIVEIDRESLHLDSILGFPDEPGVDTRVVIERHSLPYRFSAIAEQEAEEIPGEILAQEKKKRVDYRFWKTMTIDGEKAQDFDDAVSIKKLPGGDFLLGIHIADVSHYVKPGSALDKEALERGTSVYFPELTLPMLPERLSNDLCSLRPRQERLTLSVLLRINSGGKVLHTEIHPSIIKAAERLTYTSVFKIFQGDEEEAKKYFSLVPDLLLMRQLAKILRKKREHEGSLNFDIAEADLLYREGRLIEIAAFLQNEAHHLIEEFMLAANEAVALYLNQKGYPLLYRIHPPPSPADLEELRAKMSLLGFSIPSGRLSSRDLQKLLISASGTETEKYIYVQVLRSLKLASYSAENLGHYGLAKKYYTHFTSPIRRYPDLVVHRVLKQALQGKKAEIPVLSLLAEHCSARERKADEAERDLVEWRIFRFLKEKMGEEFEGIVTDITRAGIVVELNDFFVEGVIPFTEYDFLSSRSAPRLRGKGREKSMVNLGDKVRVVVASVDPLLRRIGLVLSSSQDRRTP